ncbi:MAG TPA: ribonuclease HIII [Bacillota bacterium]|nr:ribonuclease HIII [Bacillota bacterium]HPL52659.1 ribonuclease HIII [Bacillota bacterium]
MNGYRDKYEHYQYLKDIFNNIGIETDPYMEINYGLQFHIRLGTEKFLIRVYESKKNGVRCDLSQIKNEEIQKYMESLIRTGTACRKPSETTNGAKTDAAGAGLIGTDESGKGDYFGPLVIAGVYADAEGQRKLEEIGAADSKTLSDTRIEKLADEIMAVCKYSIVLIENLKYNEMYKEYGNLNKLLAWGHARVIEDLLSEVDCNNVLSDQFGRPELIENALMSKGRLVNLKQKHRAEENLVVAAASIIARNEYVRAMKNLSDEYEMEFPKGCSDMVTEAAGEFVKTHGRDKLGKVAKLHFVVTGKI